jgi:hypothetical protein
MSMPDAIYLGIGLFILAIIVVLPLAFERGILRARYVWSERKFRFETIASPGDRVHGASFREYVTAKAKYLVNGDYEIGRQCHAIRLLAGTGPDGMREAMRQCGILLVELVERRDPRVGYRSTVRPTEAIEILQKATGVTNLEALNGRDATLSRDEAMHEWIKKHPVGLEQCLELAIATLETVAVPGLRVAPPKEEQSA